ncbi:Gag Polyprotein [Phytophthora megakarya]|uniref:Gag Polyprotein n=1 Tax=Phytophthora megakarya TaxID=4795 RepID=A0A225VDG2_9STRA|nr:Gag Polyprotein [Phytophthora megakarya]
MDRSEFPHLTDAQFELVRKMAGIFGMDAFRSLAVATPAEQVERVNVLNMYERGLIERVRGNLQAPVPEPKPAGPKPLRLKVHPYEGKEGANLHFWVREVELAMDAPIISTERLCVAFALSNLGGRAKTWMYTREATSPGCVTSWVQLCEQLRAAFLPANDEYHQRSRFLACKQGKRELHEYIQEMRVLAASLVGNPLPEHIKVTVFMDGLRVSPARTQLFRAQASTMEEAIQVALQKEYCHTPYLCAHANPDWNKFSARVLYYLNDFVFESVQGTLYSFGRAHRGGLAPESLCTLEAEKGSGGLLIVHVNTVARNRDRFADALHESKDNGLVAVRLADGTVVEVPKVRIDLAVKFKDFDSTEPFIVLDMDKYDLILGMPWLQKHEPSVDWRGKAIGASRPAVSDCALESHVPTSVKALGVREEFLGVVNGIDNPGKVVAVDSAIGRETKSVSSTTRGPPEARLTEGLPVQRVGLTCQQSPTLKVVAP